MQKAGPWHTCALHLLHFCIDFTWRCFKPCMHRYADFEPAGPSFILLKYLWLCYIGNGKSFPKHGSWTLNLRTLHLRMLSLRHFIFRQLNLRVVTPSEISPSGYYNFGMFHLRDVSPSGCYTFGSFTFGKLHLWAFHHRRSSETVEGVILWSCYVPKVKHLKV